MKISQLIKRSLKWLLRVGLVGLPLMLSSTAALAERLTLVGAVLLWFYTGRVLKQRDQTEGDKKAVNVN
jgi:hypothetical protein